MLSPDMVVELNYFFAMVLFGAAAAIGYHGMLFLRAVVRHAGYVTDAEDILFFMAAGAGFFLVAYEKNNGILRWYAFAGAGLGCLAYIRTLGAFLEHVRKWLLQKLGKTVRIKAKFSSKGQVSSGERSSPEHGKKRKKKKRT